MVTIKEIDFPMFLTWEITRACNSNCRHCYNNSGRKGSKELTKEQALRLCDELIENDVLRVDILGGEPLLCDFFDDVVKKLRKADISLGLITNGLLINEHNIGFLCNNFNTIQISLDGCGESNDFMRRTKDGYEKIKFKLNLIRGRFDKHLFISTVLTKNNINDLEGMFILAKENNISRIKFSYFLPLGRGVDSIEFAPTEQQYGNAFNEIKKISREYGIKYEIEGKPGFIDRPVLPITQNWLGISPEGFIMPNPFLPVCIGDIRNDTIKDIWEKGKEYSKTILSDFQTKKNDRLLKFESLIFIDLYSKDYRIIDIR